MKIRLEMDLCGSCDLCRGLAVAIAGVSGITLSPILGRGSSAPAVPLHPKYFSDIDMYWPYLQ
jgi:hypothetical protein